MDLPLPGDVSQRKLPWEDALNKYTSFVEQIKDQTAAGQSLTEAQKVRLLTMTAIVTGKVEHLYTAYDNAPSLNYDEIGDIIVATFNEFLLPEEETKS